MAEYVNIKTNSIDKNIPTKDTFEASLPKSKTVTLTASGWNNNTQTVTVNGVSASEATQLITVSPTKTKVNKYIESGIYCSGQAENSLIFTCSEAPTEDIIIYVTIFKVGKEKKIAEITTSLSPTPGATYVEGLSGLEPADISKFANAIMVNDNITNEATSVYIDYDYGKSHRKISVADQVTIPLNGVDYKFDVIGFKHDQWSPQTYTPQESEISVASDTSLSIYKAGITFQMHDCFATTHSMNSSNTNSGGWANSLMRTSTMVTMANYLPTAWQQILKRAFKDYQTLDWCFLLSEMEVFGVNTYASDDTYTNKQYAYYKAGNSKVKNMNGYASHWYERSPQSGSSNEFCIVARDGSASFTNATLHPGTAFGFCV